MDQDKRVRSVRLATGVTLSYIARGDRLGTPVLLLHAWAESRGCFDRLIPSLPRTIRAMAMDQRGHGDADKPASGYSVLGFANDVEAFMNAVGVDSAVLLGSSSGGYVAQCVAVRSPDRVIGLAVVGSPRSLLGRPPFADDVDRLTDPVDRAWVKASLEWFPLSTKFRTGTSRNESMTASAHPHTHGSKRSPDSPQHRRPRKQERSPHPR